jgi:hypothetical protein
MWMRTTLVACFCLSSTSTALGDDGSSMRLSLGAEYTSGDYGGSSSVDEVYTPLTGSWDNGLVGLRLTVPWLTVRAPEGTVVDGPDGQPVVGEGPTRTESGVGDVIAAVTWIDALNFETVATSIDLTGTVKFGTADEDKGLGTGENDYSLQADVYKFVGPTTAILTTGYTIRGDPSEYDLDDVWFLSGGIAFRVSESSRGGVFLDWRQSAVDGADDPAELSGFLGTHLNDRTDLSAYALAGLSDSSPDWGFGLNLSRRF